MGLLLKQIFTFIKLLNSDTETNPIAIGIALGFVLGMTPTFSIQALIVFFLLFIFRIQLGTALVSAFFFKFVAFLLDPFFHSIGHYALTIDAARGLYTTMYNMPIVPFTRFNNTIVMGSGIFSFLMIPFLFFAAKFLVSKYRVVVVARFKETKFWKAVKATSLYQWYFKYDQFYGRFR